MNTQLDIREEAAKAKQWRKARGFTLDELAHLSGYSVSAIVWFERGITPAGTPTDPYAWHRYRRICSSIQQDRDFAFKWEIP
jgi:transcriptional regulator with XRE-family HTH domain